MHHSTKTVLVLLSSLAFAAAFNGCKNDAASPTPSGSAGEGGESAQAGGDDGGGKAGSGSAGSNANQGGEQAAGGEPGSGGTMTAGGNPGAAGDDGAGGEQGSAGAPATAMCTRVSIGPAVFAEYVTAEQPDPEGGDITDGTYYLTALTHYGNDEASTSNDPLHSSVKLSGNSLGWANQAKEEPEERSSFTYQINGTNLDLTKVCPTAGAGDPLPYTATETTFTFYLDAEYTFTLQQ